MASTTTIPAETTKRCDAKKIKIGDVYSRHSFGKVTAFGQDMRGNTMVEITNSNGAPWTISPQIMELEFSFADQVESEETVSRTRLIEIMMDNPRTAMTIHFNKKPNAKNIAKELRSGKAADESVKGFDARVKALLQGEERVMIGYHNCSLDEHRRLRFNEAAEKVQQRLVDLRTLNWVVVNQTRYVVGK